MTLFVFEGEKRELNLYDTIKQLFSPKMKEDILCTYKSNIYSLYSELKEYNTFGDDEEYGSVIKVLNEILSSHGYYTLSNITDEDVNEIYLFFDYDFQEETGNLDKNNTHIKEMLEYFVDETSNGKLYINYPMIESIRYTKKLPDDDYKDYCISRKDCCSSKNRFKKIAADFSYYKSLDHIIIPKNKNIEKQKIIPQNWLHLIDMNLKKANFICENLYEFPKTNSLISQLNIYDNQLKKHVNSNNCKVAILNAFPIFIADYIGFSKIKNLLFF
jgi:hypothetical protein